SRRADLGITEARDLVAADSDGSRSSQRPLVYHQAVQWGRPEEPLLHASLYCRPHRAPASDALTEVPVNRKAADRVRAGHPWIFASDVTDRGEAVGGDTVHVTDPKRRSLGTAHFSSSSQICLRMLSERAEPVDADFFARRLDAAAAFRIAVVKDSDAYRLVHAEADLLPALIVDRYGDYLVAQTLDQGMDRAKRWIGAALATLPGAKGIVLRNDAAVRRKEELPLETKVAMGEIPAIVPVRINGLEFHADLVTGQKTGIYLDQRENYVAAARYAH